MKPQELEASRFAPLGPKALSAFIWLQLLGFPGFLLSFELGELAVWVTGAVCLLVIFRASRIGVYSNSDGVVISNQWRTHQVPWRRIRRVSAKRNPIADLQFAYLVVADRKRPIRIWSSYASTRSAELKAVLRKRGSSGDNWRSELAPGSESLLQMWKEARGYAVDAATVREARLGLLRQLWTRLPFVLGAGLLLGREAFIVTLIVILAIVVALMLSIRPGSEP